MLVEAYFIRLARKQLFLQVIGDEATQLLLAWRAKPLLRPAFLEPSHFGCRDAHNAGFIAAPAIEPGIGGKQQAARQKKVQQRFLDPAPHVVRFHVCFYESGRAEPMPWLLADPNSAPSLCSQSCQNRCA